MMNVRKSLLTGVLALSTLSLFAQEKQENENVFEPHWYMQVQGGAAHTLGEAKFSKLISPAAALNVGYRFNPIIGVRVGASGWQAKGGWVNPKQDYAYKYIQGNVDAVLDLSNLFCKFNPTRFFDAYMFVGAGFNHAFDNDEANSLNITGDYDLEYLWKDSKNFIAGRGGLGANFRLSDRVALTVEGNANVMSDKFNSKKAGNSDWQFNALVGLTIKFGNGYRKAEPKYVEPVQQEEPAPVVEKKAEPAPAPVVEKKAEYRCDVFFEINSAVIRPIEAAKISDLVAFMQKNASTNVSLKGYADKGTGNAKVNKRLSEERAAAVKAALLKAGIAESRIASEFLGDSVQPFANNDDNRVTICIAE